ncbi:PH-like domain-containing protein [Amnibacterium sp.]|uniref:PH-like domain-containing protein n=1 Tax=Amnibacterium sp. TaxID=1872496 RepID=UPI003F7B53C8
MNPVSVAIVLALLVLALVGMAWSWRRRGRAQRGLAIPPVPVELGATRFTTDGLLVATTFAGRPLDRVVAGGLGFRAPAALTVTDAGVLVERAGGSAFLIPPAGGAGTASWALDRGVERDGLTVLGWSLTGPGGAPVPVESAFRLPPADQARFLAAVLPADQEAPHADD